MEGDISQIEKDIADAPVAPMGTIGEGISVVKSDYDLDQMVITLDIEGKRRQFTYWDYDEDFKNAERKDVFSQLQEQPWYAGLDHPTKMEILDASYKAIRGEEPSEYKPRVDDEPLDEGMMSEIDIDLHALASRGDEEDLIAALEGEMGPGTADVLQNMMEELKDELASKGMNDVMNDEDKMIEMLWDKIVDEYSDGDFDTEEMSEAEYQGRKVPLGKPMRGDVKKFKVYVRDPKTGNVKKVNFGHGGTSAKRAGQKTMKIKKSDPARRRSFRARHNCDNPGPRTKARYWACRAW
jgi:hypothetical protein